jgi:hypothetical protein
MGPFVMGRYEGTPIKHSHERSQKEKDRQREPGTGTGGGGEVMEQGTMTKTGRTGSR